MATAGVALRGHDPEYEAVAEEHRLVGRVDRCRAAKVAIGTLLVLSCLMLLGVTTHRRRYLRASPTQVLEAFQSSSQCQQQMKLDGCKKNAWWSCENDDGTQEWQCCCNDEIWKWQIPAKVSSSPALPLSFTNADGDQDADGARVLRLKETEDLCLGGPEGQDLGLSLATCGKANTRFKLPTSGHGNVQVAGNPGLCLGVVQGSTSRLEITRCNPGSPQQGFQLTKQVMGMLQWSHEGNKCVDIEQGKMEAGSRIELADCVYWPEKASQTFVLESAPPEPSEEEEEDKEDEEEEDAEEKNKRMKPVLEPPSLFCISLMLPRSYEVGMLQAQLARGVGIFDCDEWAVWSNESVKLRANGHGKDAVYTQVMNGSLWAPIGGAFHTALNTPIFRRLWQSVIKNPKAWRNDWIAKLDPDCVFFPGRLKQLLKTRWPSDGQAKWAAWLNNCQLGLHGPIEVFNGHALGVYNDRMDECDDVAQDHRQEDVFMGHCFKRIGVGEVRAYNLLLESEWACNERPSSQELMPPCYARQVAFHPFKSVKSYMFCYERANKMSWSSDFPVIGQGPDQSNHHHT